MKQTKIDKRLSAYADGMLEGARRTRVERELERDPVLRETLERTQSLGRLVREAWNDGPAAPPTDFLIASLRRELAAVDRERNARPGWQQALDRARAGLGRWFGPMPIATSAAAAFLLALALLPRATDPVFGTTAGPVPRAVAPFAHSPAPMTHAPRTDLFAPADFSSDAGGGIYDVSPSERPAMIFQGKDGSTVLWLLDDDGLSQWLDAMDLWG